MSSEGPWARSAYSYEPWQLLNNAGLVKLGWKENIKVPLCGLESTEPETTGQEGQKAREAVVSTC